MIEQFDLDGVLWQYQAMCWCNACQNPITLREDIIEETGVPLLIFEGDYHCTRSYPPEEMRTKIETFAEVVKAHQEARLAAA